MAIITSRYNATDNITDPEQQALAKRRRENFEADERRKAAAEKARIERERRLKNGNYELD